jgi:hypothetical protein
MTGTLSGASNWLASSGLHSLCCSQIVPGSGNAFMLTSGTYPCKSLLPAAAWRTSELLIQAYLGYEFEHPFSVAETHLVAQVFVRTETLHIWRLLRLQLLLSVQGVHLLI